MDHSTEHLNLTTISFILYIVSFFSTAKVDTIWLGSLFPQKKQHFYLKLLSTPPFETGCKACKACWVQRLQLRVPPVHQNLDHVVIACFHGGAHIYCFENYCFIIYIYILLQCSAMFCLWFVYLLTYITSIYVYYNVKRKYTKSSSLQHGG